MSCGQIKQVPTNLRIYFAKNKESVTEKLNKVNEQLEHLYEVNSIAYNKIKINHSVYKKEFGIDVNSYKEFVNNKYIDGKFCDDVKIIFDNNVENINTKFILITISKYANSIKKINELEHKKEIYEKILKLNTREYTEILSKYYIEVQKYLILKGYGYQFENKIGCLIINRCKLNKPRKKINFVATKKNKEKLIAEGVELFDKNKAEYCKKNNIPYNGVDYRIFMNESYAYEFALCYPKVNKGWNEMFECNDYRGLSLRGKSNQDLIKESNGDINYIMNLQLDCRTKLNIALEMNKMLYNKFIRNDEQKPFKDRTSNR